jgi:uncharacterized membrane protein
MSSHEVIDHFLLSHHLPSQRYRCLTLPLPRTRYFVCARCAGAFAGLLVGFPILWFYPLLISPWMLFLAFPDWIAHTLLRVRGVNAIRLVSGAVIGLVYALNLRELLHLNFRADLWIVNALAVIAYGVVVWWNLRSRGEACAGGLQPPSAQVKREA